MLTLLKWQEQQKKYEREAYQTEQREHLILIFEFLVNCLKVNKMKEVTICAYQFILMAVIRS